MRDGILLTADIHRDPAAASGPVLLMRTPYDRTKQQALAKRLTAAGFVFVAQDCRGKFASEGLLAPYNNEGQDGFDTIEWIHRQPWCNGRIGMLGGSYVGAVQWQAAVERPPGLAAIAPQATWTSFYNNLYQGGAVRLSLIAGWMAGNSAKPEGVSPRDLDEALFQLPLSDVDTAIGWPMPWLDAWLTHPRPDGFWTRVDLGSQVPHLRLPVLHSVGYYDFFARESVNSFQLMQQAADPETRRGQRLVLGPWDHGTIGRSQVADVDFGPAAAIDMVELQLDWFKRHLLNDSVANERPFPPVLYFSMGDNRWREAAAWPPAGFQPTPFYLHSAGHANSLKGDGQLLREAPATAQPPDSFRADPQQPVPASPITDQRPLKAAVWGPVDQTPLESRDDVLVYTSPTITEPLVFAGNVTAVLHVSTDTPDADWVVKLIDVHPNGFAQNLVVGIQRGRYRRSLLEPELLEPGRVYELTVDLGPCAATIAPGHQLRVDVCGALFPLYDRNPNTAAGIFGKDTAVAVEQVHHSPTTLSRLMLPLQTQEQP
jgi:putative CocE/NonD family hydrolase